MGGTIPGVLKSPNNVTSTFFNTVNLLPKDLRFKHGDPGGHVTPVRLCMLVSTLHGNVENVYMANDCNIFSLWLTHITDSVKLRMIRFSNRRHSTEKSALKRRE